MAILVSDVLTRIRDAHPLFHQSRVTNAVLVRALSNYEGTLLGKALLRDRTYLAQQASIVFATESATSGAGTGGFPSTVANDGTISRASLPTGSAQELDTSNATVLVAEFVPSASTTTSVTKSGATWTTNAYVNAVLEVTAGTGVGQRRYLTANTGTVASWATALTTPLDSTSLVRIVQVSATDPEDVGVVTAMPATDTRVAYLTKMDTNGVAYLDLTDPLVATFDRGIPLPTHKHLLGGTVRLDASTTPLPNQTYPLTLTTYDGRSDWHGDYGAYVLNRQLFLCGDDTDWQDVTSIDLRYVPEPPALTAVTDYFLLPDHAESALIAQGAYVAAMRVQALEGMDTVNLAALAQERDRAETAYLSEVAANLRAVSRRVHEAW